MNYVNVDSFDAIESWQLLFQVEGTKHGRVRRLFDSAYIRLLHLSLVAGTDKSLTVVRLMIAQQALRTGVSRSDLYEDWGTLMAIHEGAGVHLKVGETSGGVFRRLFRRAADWGQCFRC